MADWVKVVGVLLAAQGGGLLWANGQFNRIADQFDRGDDRLSALEVNVIDRLNDLEVNVIDRINKVELDLTSRLIIVEEGLR